MSNAETPLLTALLNFVAFCAMDIRLFTGKARKY